MGCGLWIEAAGNLALATHNLQPTTCTLYDSLMPQYRSYRVLVGLEIHVQLATRTKMFTGAPSAAPNFGAEPNTLVDEQVLGLPGEPRVDKDLPWSKVPRS